MSNTKWTCNECDAQFDCPDFIAELAVCESCESTDINEPVIANREFDDEADQKRLQEIRAYWDKQYAAMDFLAAATDITTCDTGTVPAIRFLQRQAS